jgi:hypothetical protein
MSEDISEIVEYIIYTSEMMFSYINLMSDNSDMDYRIYKSDEVRIMLTNVLNSIADYYDFVDSENIQIHGLYLTRWLIEQDNISRLDEIRYYVNHLKIWIPGAYSRKVCFRVHLVVIVVRVGILYRDAMSSGVIRRRRQSVAVAMKKMTV